MAVPSRPAQIARVADFIDDPENEGRDLKEIATRIVDGIYDMWAKDEKSPPMTVIVGRGFKTPALTSKTLHVAWIGKMWWSGAEAELEVAWITDASSHYGSLMPLKSPFWRIVTPYDGKKEWTGENEKGWKVGDEVSLIQRYNFYNVIATSERSVLLEVKGDPLIIAAESNPNMERYYRIERGEPRS